MLYSYKSSVATVLALVIAHSEATQVCSPSGCIDGSSFSQLLAFDSPSSTYIIPGTYSLSILSSSSSLSSSLNQNISQTSNGLTIPQPPHPVFFTSTSYVGDLSSTPVSGWKSAYLPYGWYAQSVPGKALWGAIPDLDQIPSTPSISELGYANCDPPCSSGGVCTSRISSATAGVCVCNPGWTGEGCDTCLPGYYGPSCTACSTNCTVCDDGFSGSGACLGTQTTSLKSCNCLHGTCTSSNTCTCSAGWISNSTVQCSSCAPGFFQDANSNCLACPLGCRTCFLQPGTTFTPECKTCKTDLTLSQSVPATCTTKGSCSPGQYLSNSTGTCESCSPACSTCSGPLTTDCLTCASPRVSLNGDCVGYDVGNGVCDSSLSGLSGGMFVVNNAKQECDSCPTGCLTCSIPNFTSLSSYSSLICQSCQEGWLLEKGGCVKQCSDGYFRPTGSGINNGTCQACDSSCITCIGTSKTCTKCPSSSGSAYNGSCLLSCPSTTISLNGTCYPCPPDCLTCTSPSSGSCSTCPSSRPIKKNGRCLDHCDSSSYFDIPTSSCVSCSVEGCKSCLGSGKGECTSCQDGYTLLAGVCTPTSCSGGIYASDLGICLSSLLTIIQPRKKLWPLVFLFLGLLGVGILGVMYVRRERRRTREETKAFGRTLDDKERSLRTRLETVLGMRRVEDVDIPLQQSHVGVDPTKYGQGEKRGNNTKLRQLLLPSNYHSNSKTTMKEDRFNNTKDDFELAFLRKNSKFYSIPPPPYIPSEISRQSSPTPSSSSYLQTESADKGVTHSVRESRIISLGTISPTIPSTSLNPPPKPSFRQPFDEGIEVVRGLPNPWAGVRELHSGSDVVDMLEVDGGGRLGHGYI